MQPFKIYQYGEVTNGIVFVFGGWRIHKSFYRYGIWLFNKIGLQCILFVPESKLIGIGTPYQAIIDAESAAEKIVAKKLQDVSNDKTVICMGTSFGTAWALETAKKFKQVNKVMLMAPFGDFSEHITKWTAQKYFNKIIQSQPGNAVHSAQVLNQINPSRNLSALRGKEIIIGYGANDSLIHAEATNKLVVAMQTAGLNVRVKVSKGGHYRGIFHTHNWMIKTRTKYL